MVLTHSVAELGWLWSEVRISCLTYEISAPMSGRRSQALIPSLWSVVSLKSKEQIHTSRSQRCSIMRPLVCPDSEVSGLMSKPRPAHHGFYLEVSRADWSWVDWSGLT